MRECEVRRCPRCNRVMRKVDGSEKTTRGRIWFTLQCPACLHREMDWYELPKRR